ncbi:MAG: zf-HC2 domain-containing protein [Gammaproteobacteria bacterium]|jgi:anti-sigma factor RsiW
MLTCKEFIEFIGEWYDGELPDSSREEFAAHLAKCPYCVDYLKSYEQTMKLGKAAFAPSDDEVPPDVPADLVRAILSAKKQ